ASRGAARRPGRRPTTTATSSGSASRRTAADRFDDKERDMNRFARITVAGLAAVAAVTAGVASPASAATNPYTPQAACADSFGGSWSEVSDGHRTITDQLGTKYGDVYLMYNAGSGYNCVATIKTSWVGTKSDTAANIWVQGQDEVYVDDGDYAYYAAVERHA